MSEKKRALLLSILLLAAAVRGLGVTAENLWTDELFGPERRLLPVQSLIVRPTDPHPPLYYMLQWGWMRLAGDSELALRWPSVLAGVMTVAVLHAIARRIWPERRAVALLAAGLIALSPMHVYYSQEARAYALQALCVAAAGWAGLMAVRRGGWTLWAGYVLGMLLALYMHYMAVWGLIAVGGLLLWEARRTQRVREWGLAHGAIALGYAPWLPQLAQHLALVFSPGWLAQRLSGLYESTRIRLTIEQFRVLLGVAGLLGLTVAVAGMWVLPRAWRRAERSARARRMRDAIVALLWLGVWAALVVWTVLDRGLTAQRAVFVLVPWVLLGTAAAITDWNGQGQSRRMLAGACLAVSAAGVAYMGLTEQKEAWREATALVASMEQPGDGVCIMPDWARKGFDYYYQGKAARRSVAYGELPETLLAQMSQFPRIWVVLYNGPEAGSTDRLRAWFDEHFRHVETYQFRRIELRLYER